MSSHKMGDEVSEAAFFRAALPGNTVKRLARLADVPIETARHWLYRHFSSARQREIALALLAEMDRQDREERAATRRWAAGIVGIDAADPMADPMAGAGAGVGADLAGAPAQSSRRRLARRFAEFAARE